MSYEENEFTHILYEAKMYIKTYRFTPSDQMFVNLVRVNHSVHLRNLAYFFGEKKQRANYHYSEFVADKSMVKPLPSELYGKIMRYCSGAVDHLGPDRVSNTYKNETEEWENEAFPIVIEAISGLLDALDKGVAQAHKQNWQNPYVQNLANSVRELCNLHKEGGGYVLSGFCHENTVESLVISEDGIPARFYCVLRGCPVPIR